MEYSELNNTIQQAEEYDTDDSGFYDDLSSLTESVRSSVYDYKFENGRRYHAYKEGRYFMPNDEPEQERMLYQHYAQWLSLGRRNYLSPLVSPNLPAEEGSSSSTTPRINNIRQILDLGTGLGQWSLDMSTQFPSAEIIGVDLSPIQDVYVPPNVKFEIDDIEDEWTFGEQSFDFIFSKVMLAGSIANFQKYFDQAFRATRAGGWFEIQELTTRISSDHYAIPESSAIQQWCGHMRQGIELMGRHLDLDFVAIANQIRAAGFEDVTVVPFKQPIGAWPADQTLKESGRVQLEAMLMGMESLSLAIFMRMLQWSKEETAELMERARRDLCVKRACYYWPGVVIYGRRPFETEPLRD